MALRTNSATPATGRSSADGGFLRCLRAELFSARRRPGVRIAAALWSLQIAVFAYGAQYIVYRSMGDTFEAGQGEAMLASLQPDQMGPYVAASVPGYGIPVFVILGALVAAGDYRWGVIRAILVRFPARTSFVTARWVSLQVLTLVINALGFLVGLVGAMIIAVVEGASQVLPSPGSVVVPFLASWLMMAGYSTVGFVLGVVLRSVMAAAACGAGWLVAVELLLVGSLAGAVSALDAVRGVLLSANIGSLAAGLGNAGRSGDSGLPGVSAVNEPGVAVLVIAAWTMLGLGIAISVFRRRDVV